MSILSKQKDHGVGGEQKTEERCHNLSLSLDKSCFLGPSPQAQDLWFRITCLSRVPPAAGEAPLRPSTENNCFPSRPQGQRTVVAQRGQRLWVSYEAGSHLRMSPAGPCSLFMGLLPSSESHPQLSDPNSPFQLRWDPNSARINLKLPIQSVSPTYIRC